MDGLKNQMACHAKCVERSARERRTCSPIHFFGTRDAKRLRQCENPIIISVDRWRICNSNIVGSPFGHKSEVRSCEASGKSPVYGWGRGKCVGA
ncbi:hypothetical protein AVEN_124612-1 [Araneus ventricosus]|uniref:Uncharacterized protein n=1 Tax=Araneus ventricosus TaxID=182803 RepID=A0A4Y2KVN2_ARAVE|nr:hypothetical protein AVEN_124612-1 [Araneus ventricosus]